jgi:hypothetical protein
MGAVAYLKPGTALHGLFPAGIPVLSVEPVEIPIHGSDQTGLAYVVNWALLNNDQKIDLAEILTDHRGTAPRFLKYMHDGGTFHLPVNETDGALEPPAAA